MKPLNARTVRVILILIYLCMAFLVLGIGIAAGWQFQTRIAATMAKADAVNFQLQTCRNAWTDAARAVTFPDAADRNLTAEMVQNAVRKVQILRSTADDLRKLQYDSAEDEDLRIFTEDFVSSADKAGEKLRFAGEQDKIPEFLPDIVKSLYQAEHALNLLENGDLDMNRKFVREIRNSALIFSAVLFGFFLFSLLFMLFGFSIIGSNLKQALHVLCEGTKSLRAGDLSFRFREISPDEIGEVKYDINLMARQLQNQSDGLRTANRELQEQAEQLIAAHQHKDRFLSNMSHELRTPLNSIIGFSELLEERAQRLTPDKIKSYASRVLTAADHLLSLITSLLDLAKSGAGTLKPVAAPFDLVSAITEMTDMMQPLAQKKGLEVRRELPPSLELTSDRRMVCQIFINLFSNAVKYTKEGHIRIILEKEQENAVIRVEDTGVGISEEEQKLIFTDFHRVDNGPDMVVDGVGIGLALSRRLAGLLHGGITVQSVLGKGSVFTLRLPLQSLPEK